MIKKSLFTKMLVAVLCVNMTTSTFAWDFTSVWNSARSAVSQVLSHKYSKPTALGLLAAGIGTAVGYGIKSAYEKRKAEYENKRKPVKEQITFGSISVPGKSYIINTKNGPIQIGQVDVLNQMSEEGCGGASCGYQALKNAIGIASLAKGVNWKHWLVDPALAATYFAPKSATKEPGTWRAEVIQYRQNRVLGLAIEESIRSSDRVPGGDADDPLRAVYNEIYPKMLSAYAAHVAQEVLSGHAAHITLDSFVAWFQRQLDENIASLTEHKEVAVADLANRIKNRELIRAYFNLTDDFDRNFSSDMLEQLVRERMIKTTTTDAQGKRVAGEHLELDGENTTQNELVPLYEGIKQDPKNTHLKNTPLITIDARAEKLRNGPLEPAADAIRQRIAKKQPLKRDAYPFILNLGGHWVTAVLDTNQKGIRRYTLANSTANNPEIFSNSSDGRMIDFIGKLEGCKNIRKLIPETPSAGEQPEIKPYGFGRYCSHMWKRFKKAF